MWKLYIAATLEKRIAWISEPVLRLKSRDVVFEIKNTCAIAKKKKGGPSGRGQPFVDISIRVAH